MYEELNQKINLWKEVRAGILHNWICYEGKEDYIELYQKYTKQLALINSIMNDVINTYPDIEGRD